MREPNEATPAILIEALAKCGEKEAALRSRVAALEAENNFVRETINAYVASGFDPSMMGRILDDIRHHLKVVDPDADAENKNEHPRMDCGE